MDVSKGELSKDHVAQGFRPPVDSYNHPCSWHLDLPPLSMPEMLARTADACAHSPLVEFHGRYFSYADIHREALAFAAGLQRMGVEKGDRIGLFLPNVPIYVSAYFGAMIAGAVVVNFSPLYSVDELDAQVEDSGTKILITLDVPALLPTALEVLDQSSLETLVVGRLASMLPRVKGALLRLFGGSQTTRLPKRADVLDWQRTLADSTPLLPRLDPERDIALIQYTGGTTGTPKGAMLSHQNLTANARQVDAIDPFREGQDMIMGVLPLFHVFANTCVLNRTVCKGGCLAMLPRFDAGDALKTMERVKATSFPGVPTMYQAMLDHKRLPKTDFSALKVCISGGAPLPGPLQDEFEAVSHAKLVEGYGLTESSGVVSTNPYAGENRHGTIGQPLPETWLRLLDKEDSTRDAPPGEPGELAIRGPQVMQGYWNRPQEDANVFATREDGIWLRTGDIATIDPDGYIRIVDRSKDMITVGGFKVFPSQVEEVLQRHPSVREVLVIGLPDDYLGERPAAYLALNDTCLMDEQGCPDGEALCNWANAHLGKHERLVRVEVMDALPKTPIGKLDRKSLRRSVLGA